jgi:CRISPR/Cas system-associated protein endoribonuclease Cas2
MRVVYCIRKGKFKKISAFSSRLSTAVYYFLYFFKPKTYLNYMLLTSTKQLFIRFQINKYVLLQIKWSIIIRNMDPKNDRKQASHENSNKVDNSKALVCTNKQIIIYEYLNKAQNLIVNNNETLLSSKEPFLSLIHLHFKTLRSKWCLKRSCFSLC